MYVALAVVIAVLALIAIVLLSPLLAVGWVVVTIWDYFMVGPKSTDVRPFATIERDDRSEISLPDWSAAVAAADGVRLSTEPPRGVNPFTGEASQIVWNDGDVEASLDAEDDWTPCLQYAPDQIRFIGPAIGFEQDSPLHETLTRLAARVDAEFVYGDNEFDA